MDLRQLRYFVMVATELHFGRAALRLHIAQPALSLQVKALEDALGVTLLNRTTRTITLTEPGRLFLDEARRTLEHAEYAALVARRAGRGELGRIDIGYDANGAYSGILSTALRYYRERAPETKLGLHGAHPETQIADLSSGKLHAGFVTRPTGLRTPSLAHIRLAQWPLRLAIPAHHPLAECSTVTTRVLEKEPFIGLTRSAGSGYESYVNGVVGFETRMAYEADGAFALLSLVGAGLGVAIVPSSISSIDVGEKVVYRRIEDVNEQIVLDIIFRPDESEATVQTFLSILRQMAHSAC